MIQRRAHRHRHRHTDAQTHRRTDAQTHRRTGTQTPQRTPTPAHQPDQLPTRTRRANTHTHARTHEPGHPPARRLGQGGRRGMRAPPQHMCAISLSLSRARLEAECATRVMKDMMKGAGVTPLPAHQFALGRVGARARDEVERQRRLFSLSWA